MGDRQPPWLAHLIGCIKGHLPIPVPDLLAYQCTASLESGHDGQHQMGSSIGWICQDAWWSVRFSW